MEIRTFYWEDNIISQSRAFLNRLFRKASHSQFIHGNAGDIYARDLLIRQYNTAVKNVKTEGNRLLCVGSIAHRALPGDVLCGVGVKLPELMPKVNSATDIILYGLRGPLSYAAFKKAGFDVSSVKFLYDPGLLIKYFELGDQQEPREVSFIPHYRERYSYRKGLPKGIQLIDIDNPPDVVASCIKSSKLVYSSSLHGIIFAHSLGIPCVYVKPQTDETEFKFIDYYESVNLTYKKPLSSIADVDFIRDSDTPADVDVRLSDFYFPSVNELEKREIIKS